ncbi:pilin [Vibrio vulnificus]|uniref:Pilin n=1 Tax=Vibrio vulnificus TaxID=672 RepID=A0A2S3QYZ1_VIBVL|nr:pilin [Vibrio vulnificus]OJI59638.1 Fimbrial protein precursor [Vibrio fluvialis]EGR0127298.1 pilin [Vibrio vulnificus]EHH0749277.1 pilin [Vibrio vulnificus]EHK9016878.1 pilin [Vibrio vulnificus]EHT4940493.1 pilin [Vibrio vulnificus]
MKKLNKTKKQQGFTLIELMIVIAVIGVLSAIAFPQYQKYVAKSEIASVLATLTGAKTNVEATTVETGAFPAAGKETALGVPAMPLGTVAFAPNADNPDAGTITFTFDAAGADASALVAGKKLILTRTTATGAWACTSDIKKADSLLPKTCTGAD